MRVLILAAALLAAACSVDTDSGGNAAPHGYRLEIRADKDNKIFLITAPDGRATGGMVSGGQSTLLTAHALDMLAQMPTPPAPAQAPADDEHHVSFRAPGISMDVSGNDDDDETSTSTATGATADHGQAHLSFNFGGRSMQIDAQGNEGDGNAHVVINGADAKTARDFVNNNDDDLSPSVKQQMLQAVGL